MENEAEENFSAVKTVKVLQNEKVFLNIDEGTKATSIDANNTGIYEYDITKPISLNKSGSFVEDDDSCLTTTITTNELCDSNSVLSLTGANISETTQIDDTKNEDLLESKDSKEKSEEQSAFDIQPICMDTNAEELSQSTQITSKVGRRSSANHEVGPRQLKYNQIGVYWKDKESRVYARFTWATRKYSKSFYVGPNKPYATVRDAEKAAIRFLLINSPLHRRSHLKHFRFTESDEEEDEPYVGSQALKEARRTKGIMLHFPAPESDDEVWSHYNTSNINPATLYGEIIKKMDNDSNTGVTSPITSAREYVTAKNKQSSSGSSQNDPKFVNSISSALNENISSDELLLAMMSNQIDNDRMVERQPTCAFINNPSTSTTTVSSKRFKPCSKTETLDSSEMNYSNNQLGSTFIDQNISSGNNPFVGMDYNTLVAIQHAQMANYYLQQQVAYATAANLAITSNAGNITSNNNPFVFTQYGISPIANIEQNRVDESEIDRNLLNAKNIMQSSSAKKIAECTMEQYGAVIPSQETKTMPSSNITLCSTIPGSYQPDYMAAMAAAYSSWYSPYGYAMPLVGSYAPMIPSIVPNPNILGNQFQNNINIATGQLQSNNGTVLLHKQVNKVNSIDPLVNSRIEKELQNNKEQEVKQSTQMK